MINLRISDEEYFSNLGGEFVRRPEETHAEWLQRCRELVAVGLDE